MSSSSFATAALVSLGLTIAAAPAQNAITWFSVVDMVDAKTDISTNGNLVIAANFGPEVCEKVVQGVHFQADRSHFTKKILVRGGAVVRGQLYFPTFTSGGHTLTVPYNRTAPNIGPRSLTEADYNAILKDGRHSSGGTRAVVCKLEGLKPGQSYTIQIFYGNKGRPTRITEWDNGVGDREGKGGIFLQPSGALFGQVATGFFVADASGTQTFTNYQQPANSNTTPPLKETFNACSAIQVRTSPISGAAWTTYYGEGTPGSNTQPSLGGTRCSPAINLSGHPKMGASVNLTAENSSGLASSALIVLGAAPTSLPLLTGTLLVVPLLTVPVPMPIPVSPFVHDHELVIPATIPNAPGLVYVQVLQLDAGAAGGVSFTPALQIEIGI